MSDRSNCGTSAPQPQQNRKTQTLFFHALLVMALVRQNTVYPFTEHEADDALAVKQQLASAQAECQALKQQLASAQAQLGLEQVCTEHDETKRVWMSKGRTASDFSCILRELREEDKRKLTEPSDVEPSHADVEPSHADQEPSRKRKLTEPSDVEPSHAEVEPSQADPEPSHAVVSKPADRRNAGPTRQNLGRSCSAIRSLVGTL
jgi:hypothetical protein